MMTRAGTNTPSDEYDSYREYRVANTNMYSRIMGHSTSNEMMAHALRPRILFNFFSVLPNYPYEQIQNLSFLLQIVFELKLFS